MWCILVFHVIQGEPMWFMVKGIWQPDKFGTYFGSRVFDIDWIPLHVREASDWHSSSVPQDIEAKKYQAPESYAAWP